MKKIIINEIYKHRNGAIIVRFTLPEISHRSNINFNPIMFEGLTKEETKKEIQRHLKRYYQRKMREAQPIEKQKLDDAIKEMEGLEIE